MPDDWWTQPIPAERLVPTDLCDPATGEPLYVSVRVRPWWWPYWRRVALFVSIVWREDQSGGRMAVATAWAVATIVHPVKAKRRKLGLEW